MALSDFDSLHHVRAQILAELLLVGDHTLSVLKLRNKLLAIANYDQFSEAMHQLDCVDLIRIHEDTVTLRQVRTPLADTNL